MHNIQARFNQYQHAIEQSNIVSKTDINGIITFVNDEFCKISGYTKDELIGKNHNIVRHPDVKKESFKILWDTILSKKVYKAVAKNITKDGKTVYLNTTIFPILKPNGEIEEFIALRYDTTMLVEANERLIKQESELKKLNENLEALVHEKTAELKKLNENLKDIVKIEIEKNEEKTKMLLVQSRLASMGEMIANIAHQWRQPLNELSISLYKMKKDKSSLEESYQHCKSLIKNMSNTIEDFRNFFSSNNMPERFSILNAVKDSIHMLQGSFQKHDIKIFIKLEDDSEIYGYKSQLTQVIINLLNNAKDAYLEREIEQKHILVKIFKQDDCAVVIVCDTAGGIDDSIKDKIFEPYFTTKHSSQGTGIGLYMSKLIIDRLDGNIDVKNENNGACFKIKIPIKGEIGE